MSDTFTHMKLTDWEARRTGACNVGQATRTDFPGAPAWFKFEAGFKFIDGDEDPCVVVGVGSFTQWKPFVEATKAGQLHGYTPEKADISLVYVTRYKGSWLFSTFESSASEDSDFWTSLRPVEGE